MISIGKRLVLVSTLWAAGTCFLFSTTFRVPRDFLTIKGAVLAARDGDTVEVDDGHYLEDGIVLDKAILLKSKNTLGAIIQGSSEKNFNDFIFLVKAPVEIEGFILKNSFVGILQRDSPDVGWTARQLVILNMKGFGVAVNQARGNWGRASLRNIHVDSSHIAFATNDAYGMDIQSCMVTNCEIAFEGYNHVFFKVDKILIWNCGRLAAESSEAVFPPATNSIQFGSEMTNMETLFLNREQKEWNQILLDPQFSGDRWLQGRPSSSRMMWQSLSLVIAGDIFLRFEDFKKARAFYLSALLIGRKSGCAESVWRSHLRLGWLDEKFSNDKAALDNYQKAAEIFERIRKQFMLRGLSPGFLLDKITTYESLVRVLARLQEKEPTGTYSRQAFLTVERWKARGILDSFKDSGLIVSSKDLPEFQVQEKFLSDEIAGVQIRLADRTLTKMEREDLLTELEKIENEYKNLMIQVKRKDPEFAHIVYPDPLGYDQVKTSFLDENTAVLEYMMGENDSFAVLATVSGLRISKLPSVNHLRPLVRNYLKFLSMKDGESFKSWGGSERLYDLLLEPVLDPPLRNITKLIIVPDDDLHYLPFETLAKRNGTGDDRFLVEDYEISYVPSASVLYYLKQRNKGVRPKPTILAVANSRFERSRRFLSLLPSDIPPLKYAGREIRAIARFFDKGRTTLLFDKDATEAALIHLDMNRFDIIHLATHGVLDDERWWRSGLFLYREESAPGDGFLQPLDIIRMKLMARLVVLSACGTGKGKLEKGEGILGLAGSFLYAGSRSVLVSLWNINDRSTAFFMERFYQNLTSGCSAGKALKSAKLEMLRSSYRHPFYWAAFVLIGDENAF